MRYFEMRTETFLIARSVLGRTGGGPRGGWSMGPLILIYCRCAKKFCTPIKDLSKCLNHRRCNQNTIYCFLFHFF